MLLRPALLCALAAFAAAPASALAADPPKCKLARIAEWPVQLRNNLPLVDGAINGKKATILLDTGADTTMVNTATAEKLGLVLQPTFRRAVGFGGTARIYATVIEELRIADAVVRKGMRVLVTGERAHSAFDFILGDDFFRQVELEFDYAKGVVRLFHADNCKNAWLGYWDANALQVPLENDTKIVFPLTVNGRPARALLDSGASASVVSMPFAARLGITPQSGGVVQAGCSGGVGEGLVPMWVARFDSIAIAGENIRDARLRIADFMPELAYSRNPNPEVMLGTDFLRAHRVMVSRSQGKVYFSYAGGLVFPATPALACDERSRDEKEALAANEAALARDPNDVQALTRRAMLRARNGDRQAALADLDAAIRVEPGNAVALDARSAVRAGLRDYDGALADSEAAINNGMRSSGAYVRRGDLRRAQGDLGLALDEYEEALRLEPTNPVALASRGRLRYYAGNYEAAERDFAALAPLRQNAFDAIWLYLARARRGVDGRADLESRTGGDDWGPFVGRFLAGKVDRDALMAAATNVDEKQRSGRLCEARFYLAERLTLDSKPAEARPLLEQVRAECPRNYIEYEAAAAELKRL
jgi:predicted aspartyl protease/tetratricopeptide (TPR) repeat protein